MNTLKSFQPETWETVSRNLLTKMIAEFMYEDIIHPDMEKADGENQRCRLELKSGVTYTFEVKKRLFDSYRVHGDTIYRQENGEVKPADNPIQFLLDIQSTIGMNSMTAGHLIREYTHTLVADAYILEKRKTNSWI